MTSYQSHKGSGCHSKDAPDWIELWINLYAMREKGGGGREGMQ